MSALFLPGNPPPLLPPSFRTARPAFPPRSTRRILCSLACPHPPLEVPTTYILLSGKLPVVAPTHLDVPHTVRAQLRPTTVVCLPVRASTRNSKRVAFQPTFSILLILHRIFRLTHHLFFSCLSFFYLPLRPLPKERSVAASSPPNRAGALSQTLNPLWFLRCHGCRLVPAVRFFPIDCNLGPAYLFPSCSRVRVELLTTHV